MRPLDSTDQPATQTGCHLLVVNPNGNPAVTELVRGAAERILRPGTIANVVNPRGSPLSIETADERRKAEHLALDLLAAHPDFDAYVMACFDDIAVETGRRLLNAPVVDTVVAAIAAVRLVAERFALITTVENAVPGIRARMATFGMAGRCFVHAAGVGVAAAADASAAVAERIDEAIHIARCHDGVEAIVLASGGLTGRAPQLALRHGLPVTDAIEAALVLAESMALQRNR